MNTGTGGNAGFEQFLNSDWAFGLTQSGGRHRQWLLFSTAGIFWGLGAYISHLPSPNVFAALNLMFYPFSVLLENRVFAVLLVGLICFQLILYIALTLLNRPIRKFRNWQPAVLVFLLVGFKLMWGPYLYTPVIDLSYFVDFILYVVTALISPEIMQFVLVGALAFWVAYRTAAVYLDDIYELGDIQVARRFILQAAFSTNYTLMEIEDGDVAAKHKKLPMFRIGGPGRVRVHLDNAALFESIDGSPRVIGPTVQNPNNAAIINGFERLRSIINLTDQFNEYSIEGRTRDGIPIRLNNVNVVYSVYRGGQPSSLLRPYPFENDAIMSLVYDQGKTPWMKAVDSLIRRSFGEFISKHTLSEFLAAIGTPEVEQSQNSDEALMQRTAGLAGTQLPGSANPLPTPPDFRARPDMMTELFTAQFTQRAAEKGVELKWIGGGTWELPENLPSKIVSQRHLEAWKLSRENLMRMSPEAHKKIRQDSQMVEMARLTQEIPIRVYRDSKDKPAKEAMRAVIIAYYRTLHGVYEQYKQNPTDPAQMEWLRQVLVYMTRFTARWLGGP